MTTQFIVRDPFPGYIDSTLKADGTVAYTNGLSWEDYKRDSDYDVRLVDEPEVDALFEQHEATLITEPKEVDAETWDYALGVLPPCRWHTHRGVNIFHISERITGNLVDWYAQIGGRYFSFTDRDNLSSEALAEKVWTAI